jgi:hypothetical protein
VTTLGAALTLVTPAPLEPPNPRRTSTSGLVPGVRGVDVHRGFVAGCDKSKSVQSANPDGVKKPVQTASCRIGNVGHVAVVHRRASRHAICKANHLVVAPPGYGGLRGLVASTRHATRSRFSIGRLPFRNSNAASLVMGNSVSPFYHTPPSEMSTPICVKFTSFTQFAGYNDFNRLRCVEFPCEMETTNGHSWIRPRLYQ